MGSKQRYVILGIVVLAFIAGLALSHGLQWIWAQIGWDDPYLFGVRDLSLSAVLGYGLAIAGVVFCLKHAPTFQLASEIVDELSKVSWPTREETGNATVVVVVTVLICAAYLGAFDAVWLALTDWVLGIEASPAG